MSKAASYLDWELNLKNDKITKSNKKSLKKKSTLNSIGIDDGDFLKFLEKWKENNL